MFEVGDAVVSPALQLTILQHHTGLLGSNVTLAADAGRVYLLGPALAPDQRLFPPPVVIAWWTWPDYYPAAVQAFVTYVQTGTLPGEDPHHE